MYLLRFFTCFSYNAVSQKKTNTTIHRRWHRVENSPTPHIITIPLISSTDTDDKMIEKKAYLCEDACIRQPAKCEHPIRSTYL